MTNTNQHITFDLETLGTYHNAPIVQLGAVKFTTDGDIKDEFLKTFKLSSLEGYGFEPDYGTIQFWFKQSPEAINSVFNVEDKTALYDGLQKFQNWIGKNPKDFSYWSHATFDPVLLTNACKKLGLKDPISYRNHRDIRTLSCLYEFLTGKEKTKTERVGIHHNALDDAKFQAAYISEMLVDLQRLTGYPSDLL